MNPSRPYIVDIQNIKNMSNYVFFGSLQSQAMLAYLQIDAEYLKTASPLPPTPLTVAGFPAWLASPYSDHIDGLLACFVFAVRLVLSLSSLLKCGLASWFLDVNFRSLLMQ